MNLYVKFRGKEPSMDAFLERSGLKHLPPSPHLPGEKEV
jgi:hypothetical protein